MGLKVVLLLLTGTLGGLKIHSDRTLLRFAEANPPVGEFVAAEGVRVHYLSRGAGWPVVFVHGADGVLQDFTLSILDRAAEEFMAVAVDRPGHGYSERPRRDGESPVVQARVLRSALRELGIEQPVLVGHSWGAALALAYAVDYPNEIADVVTVGGHVIPHGGMVHPLNYLPSLPLLGPVLVHTLLVPFGSATIASMSAPAFAPAEVPAVYVETMKPFVLRPAQFKNNAEGVRSLNAALREIHSGLESIRVPVILVHGERDRTVPVRHAHELKNILPQARLIVLPDAGHMPHYTHPEAIIDAIHQVVDAGLAPS
jgi:pimeloyl-ACP methyl ester carboxylesterase